MNLIGTYDWSGKARPPQRVSLASRASAGILGGLTL